MRPRPEGQTASYQVPGLGFVVLILSLTPTASFSGDAVGDLGKSAQFSPPLSTRRS